MYKRQVEVVLVDFVHYKEPFVVPYDALDDNAWVDNNLDNC